MTQKTLQAWIAGCGWALMLRLLITAGVIALLGVFLLTAAVIPLPRGVDRQYVFLGAFVVAVVAGMLTAIVVAVGMVVRRAAALDAAFGPLGVRASQYLTNGRQYHGRFGGRQMDAYFYRGPTLDLYLSTSLKTRLNIGQRDAVGLAVAGALKREPLAVTEPSLAHLSFFGLDEAWAQSLLADPEARAALLRLTADRGGFESRQVHLQPGGWLLRRHHARTQAVTAESVGSDLAELAALARAAEALPPPRQTVEATNLERNTQSNRNAFTLPAVAFTCGLVAVLSLCAFVPVVFLILFETR